MRASSRQAEQRPKSAVLFLARAATLALLTSLACTSAPDAGDTGPRTPEASPAPPSLALKPCGDGRGDGLCGTLEVFEDREAAKGRKISLNIRVIPASEEPRRPDPVFLLAGGPGQGATRLAGWAARQWFRDPHRDLVLVDQRGTGASNGLDCDLLEAGADPITAMQTLFEDVSVLERCRDKLEQRADLRHYTTPEAMDDLDDVRRALGYDKVDVVGGSYGSRAGLIYLRRHGENVRAAVLWGPAPLANTLPLYHARSGQRALDRIFEQCAGEEACGKAFPDLRGEFAEILSRLERKPVVVPLSGTSYGQVTLTRDGFAEGLRVQLYTTRQGRGIPKLLHAAFEGNYEPFARRAAEAMGGLLGQVDLGMLLSVTCSEEVPRIDPGRIEALTRGSFLRDNRIQRQIDICRIWPKQAMPGSYGEPVRSDRPVLVIAGDLDPVTPPEWGEETVRHLAHGRLLTVPLAHDAYATPCVAGIATAFLFGDPEAPLDTSCVAEMTLPEFDL